MARNSRLRWPSVRELCQVSLGEIRQHGEVNVGLRKGRALLTEPKTLQPLDDRLHRSNASF